MNPIRLTLVFATLVTAITFSSAEEYYISDEFPSDNILSKHLEGEFKVLGKVHDESNDMYLVLVSSLFYEWDDELNKNVAELAYYRIWAQKLDTDIWLISIYPDRSWKVLYQ